MLFIKNATVYGPERLPGTSSILIDQGRIRSLGPSSDLAAPPGATVIDATGFTVVPGFIDLQFNGAFGHDFTNDAAPIWSVAARLPRFGVTSFLPTIITAPLDRVAAGQQVIAAGPPQGFTGAMPLGLHVEGPYLNVAKKGAHNPKYLRPPDRKEVADWSPSTGIRLVTIAPELPGALEVITDLSRRGVLVSAGHSMATYEEAMAAFDAGVRYGTHLFSAMPSLAHREPGLPGALLTDSRPLVGFIADGVHTHQCIIDLVWRALGSARLSLVTDAMAALGMPPGWHRLGDYDVQVDATSARLDARTLAGSILSLDRALRNVIRITGCSLESVLPTLTTNNAKAIGLGHDRGRIAIGFVADLVVLSPDLEVYSTVAAGQVAYTAGDAA